MAGTLRNLLVRIGADVTGFSAGLRNAQKQVRFFGRNVTGSMKEIQGSLGRIGAALGGALTIKTGIQDAMRYEALMTTLGETLGESRKQFEDWQKSTGSAMGFSMLQGAELGNMLSLNFTSIAKDTADLTKKTTDMMELAAVVSNKRGMAMSEVSDRIRSAMNQEADGAQELGVDVRFAAIQTSKAYKEMGNNQPFDQLSESIRKTILYHHIFEQVNKNLGMTMQDTTAMRMAQFTAILGDVRMALGQAFLPIMYSVLPLLTSMAKAIYNTLTAVAVFTRTLFGGGFKYKPPVDSGDVKTTQAQTKALNQMGDAAESTGSKSEKAAAKSKKAWAGTFGFDEVNTIKEPDESASGGGGAGAGAEDLAFEEPVLDIEKNKSAFDLVGDKVSELGLKLRNFFEESRGFKLFKDGLKDFWQALKDFWNSEAISNFRKNFAEDIPNFLSDLALIGGGAFEILGGAIDVVNGFINVDFVKAVEGASEIVSGFFKMVAGTIGLVLPNVRDAMLDFAEDFAEKWDWFYKLFIKDSKSLEETANRLGAYISGKILEYIEELRIKAARYIFELVNDMSTRFSEWREGVRRDSQKAWDNFTEPFKDLGRWFDRNVIDPISNGFRSIADGFDFSLTGGFKSVYNQAVGFLNNMIKDINGIEIPNVWGGVNLPTIPKLAKGGITSGPTLAVVGDNVGGREVISPLDKLQGIMTNTIVQALQLGGATGNQNSGDIVLNIDGRTFARIVKPFMDKEQSRVGNDVRIRTI